MKSRLTAFLSKLLVVIGFFIFPSVDSFALPANFQNTAVLNGFLYPTAVRFAPNGKIFVAEKSGLIKVFDSISDTTPTIFADLRSQVQDYGDRGLLGLAIDPQFPARPFVYVFYTVDAPTTGNPPFYNDNCSNPDNCLVRSRLSKLTASGDTMTSEQILLEDKWCQIENSHSVGTLAFGPEGALYLSHGDGASFNYVDFGQDGGCSDPVNEGGALRSQDLRTSGASDPLSYDGAVLRLNPDTGAAFAGNPLAGGTNTEDDRMIAYGFRNPYRFSVDSETGALWIADVGWNEWEEVDYISSPTAAPIGNYGWPCYEGPFRQSGYDAANIPICENLYTAGVAKAPYYTYAHNGSSRAISAIALYRGSNFPPEYNGALFIGDYTQEWIRVIVPGPNGLPDINSAIVDFVTGAFPVDIQVGPDGALYYIDIALGEVHQIKYFSSNTPPVASFTSSTDSGALPLTVNFNGTASSDPDIGDTLQYAWDLDGDGAFDDSTAVSPSFTYTTAQTLLVRLRVTDSHGATNIASTTIFAGNRAPVVTINTPLPSKLFSVGETLSFSGSATDPDFGILPASALKWDTILLHCALNDPSQCHEHSIQTFNGVYSGFILSPDHEYPSRIVFRLTATDPANAALTRTASVTLQPLTTTWTFNSQPSGLQLAVYGAQAATPFTRTVIVNAQSTVSAPLIQQSGLSSYQFSSWSDGGGQTHTVTATAAPKTFTAVYSPVSTQTTWNSWDTIVQNASPQGSIVSNTGLTAFLEFYESTNDLGVTKGALFNNFLAGPHQDAGNNVESFWTNSTVSAPYPYAGKSTVSRGADISEGGAPAPLNVNDLQLFAPNNNHDTVAAFRIPQTGNYTISNIAVRKVMAQGDNVRLHIYNNQGVELTTLTASINQDWVTTANTFTINNIEAGQYIYFAVDRNGTSAGDAAEISWSIAATFTASPPAPTCSLTPNPATIAQGQNTTLSWVSSDATSLSLDHGIGSQAFVVTGSVVQSPAATTTYTATASGAGGNIQCLATVTVTDPSAPTCALSIAPTTITQGSPATLSWTSANAVAGSIDQGVGPLTAVSGSVSIFPTVSTVYTGTAVGANGTSTTCSANIIVTPPAATCTLSASPASITSGNSSNLSWTSQNATAVSINQGIGSVTPVASGSRSISPTATTTYTATATGPGGTNTCSQIITVTVAPQPACTLNASPTTITSGGSSTLSWASTNATAISINQGIGSVTPVASGSRSVSPTATLTYTATVTGPGGTGTCTRAITVNPPAATCTLNATPTSIAQGGSTSLSWASTNATAISINQGIGSVTPVASGSRSVSPAVTTIYTATATGPGGTGTCSRTVTVTAPVATCTLSVVPTTITRGSSAALSWTSQNAVSGAISPGVGAITSTNGTVSVAPTTTTTYVGTANNASGASTTCTATLTVNP